MSAWQGHSKRCPRGASSRARSERRRPSRPESSQGKPSARTGTCARAAGQACVRRFGATAARGAGWPRAPTHRPRTLNARASVLLAPTTPEAASPGAASMAIVRVRVRRPLLQRTDARRPPPCRTPTGRRAPHGRHGGGWRTPSAVRCCRAGRSGRRGSGLPSARRRRWRTTIGGRHHPERSGGTPTRPGRRRWRRRRRRHGNAGRGEAGRSS